MAEKSTNNKNGGYAARLNVDYPAQLDRGTTFFRLLWIIPVAIILSLLTGNGETVTKTVFLNEAGEIIKTTRDTAGGAAMGITTAVALMIVFTQTYPQWWFNFLEQLTRFEYRVMAYGALMTDQYPSVIEEQSVHVEIDYPDVQKDLNRWMPLVKWLLAVPHYIVLAFLSVGSFFAVVGAWFVILFTGEYPKRLFDYNVGVMRWWLRVRAYMGLLVTDDYPPFSLK